VAENERPNPDLVYRSRLAIHGRLVRVARPRARPATIRADCDCREVEYRADQSLRHVAETVGIPACEIGSASVDGSPWSLELPPPEGSVVELYPVSEPVELGQRPSFMADTHLGRLSRTLRLLGFDSAWRGDMKLDDAVEITLAEERVFLSRDRKLLFGRAVSRPAFFESGEQAAAWRRGMLILAQDPYRQLLEVCARFALDRLWKPLSLCSACGAEIESASKAEVIHLLPEIVAERYNEFSRCPACGKIFWKGDHARNIEPLLARLRSDMAPR